MVGLLLILGLGSVNQYKYCRSKGEMWVYSPAFGPPPPQKKTLRVLEVCVSLSGNSCGSLASSGAQRLRLIAKLAFVRPFCRAWTHSAPIYKFAERSKSQCFKLNELYLLTCRIHNISQRTRLHHPVVPLINQSFNFFKHWIIAKCVFSLWHQYNYIPCPYVLHP